MAGAKGKAKATSKATANTVKAGRVEKKAASQKANTSRKRSKAPPKAAQKAKRPARARAPLNRAPTQRLRVAVFGNGGGGELGLGAMEYDNVDPEMVPRPVVNRLLDPETVGVVQLAVGGLHCVALTHDGVVLTWGVNDSKALGRDTTYTAPEETPDGMTDLNPLEATPTPVTSLQDIVGEAIVQVAATDGATFVLTESGKVYGWGLFYGSDGPYGFLTENIRGKDKPPMSDKVQQTPIQIQGVSLVKQLATGTNHVLALTRAGEVYVWGTGQQSELGQRVSPRRDASEALTPRIVKRQITQIFAGFHHSFAVDTRGRVWAWGLNNFGQTAMPRSDDDLRVETPAVVQSLAGYRIRGIARGSHHGLACAEDGTVLVWGRCDDGQAGVDIEALPAEVVTRDSRGNPRILTEPTVVPDLKASYVAAAIDDCLAVDMEGNVFGWGFSDSYRTGLATDDTVERPTKLRGRAMKLAEYTFAGCGGQFSVIAGIPKEPEQA